MKRQTKFAMIAAGLFILLIGVEQWRSGEPFDPWNFAADLLEMALLAGAVAMTAFTSAETRDFRLERLELIDDLGTARRRALAVGGSRPCFGAVAGDCDPIAGLGADRCRSRRGGADAERLVASRDRPAARQL